MSKTTFVPKVIPAALLALASQQAFASGFQLLEQNASGLGNAYAGSAAVAENASTVFFNPAGMTYLSAREVSFGVNAIQPSYKFTNQGSTSGALSGNGGDAGQLGLVPNAYGTWQLSKDLYFGIGVGAPFGLATKYQKGWIGAAQSEEFDIKTVNVNPSLAWRVNDDVSIGFGLDWQRLDATYKKLAGAFPGAGLVNIRATVKLDDDTWGWNAGMMIKLTPATRLGLSYRSEVKYDLKGDIKLASDGSPTGNVVYAGLPTALQSKLKASLTLPETFIASLHHKLDDRWDLLGEVSWTGWSSIPKLDLIRTSGALSGATAQTLVTDFQDTWRVALGANNKLNDKWKMRYGIAFDQTPVKNADHRLVSLPDNDRVWLSMGTQYTVSPGSVVDVGLAYLHINSPKINNNQMTNVPPAGTVKGEYEGSVWILGAQYSASF